MRFRFAAVSLAILFATALGAPADAGETKSPMDEPISAAPRAVVDLGGPVYRINLAADLTTLLLGGAIVGGWFLGDDLGPAHCAPLCDRGEVSRFDRFAAGNYSPRWAIASDITLGGAMAVGVAALFADQRSVSAFSDLLVVAESVVLANALIVTTNLASRRPRPYLYSEKAPEKLRESGSAALSFPSGHVGAATALTASVFGVLYVRHPDSAWPWVFLGFGTAASGAIAAGRILSGRHFLSDVLVGAAEGACIGVLVPALHKKNLRIVPTVGGESAGLAITGQF